MSTSARLGALLLHRLDPSTTPQFAQYAPVLYFDEAEPFLPLAVGCTRFDSPAPSLSFPRMITLHDDHFRAAYALEYAIWWDWDIEHLYELEHIWVWIDSDSKMFSRRSTRATARVVSLTDKLSKPARLGRPSH